MFVNILLHICSMIVCETDIRPRGKGFETDIRPRGEGFNLYDLLRNTGGGKTDMLHFVT